MTVDVLPEKLVTPTRDDLVRRYERDWKLRFPGAAVGPGTEPGTKARIVADLLLPLYGEAARNAQVASLDDMDRSQLGDTAESLGLPRELEAVGSAGAVTITASSGGGTIFAGDEIKDELTGFRWQCSVTAVYTTGQSVPIAGVDTGTKTNTAPGRSLTWTSPRPGIASTAIVVTQSDGSGLSGGRDLESNTDIIARIRDARANPAVAGNDADYRAAAMKVQNVGIQAAFTYPGIDGPGTIGLAFTLRPATAGASRLPNNTQRALVRGQLIGQFPKDDGLLSIALLAQAVTVRLKVRWAVGAKGWIDASPWPAYDAVNFVYVKAVTSTTSFRLASADTAHVDVAAGQTIAFYNPTTGTFVRKKVLTPGASTAGGERLWDVVCDTSNGASDTAFRPSVNTRPSPWSDSLDALATPVIAYFDTLGPGEMVAAPYLDAGLRQKRSPESPSAWPSVITGRMATPLYVLPAVADVQVVAPTPPYSANVGTPGVSAYLLELASLGAFPL